MKLTVKAEKRDKVRAFVRDFEDYGCINRPFDTEDFVELENSVILSVEEAKVIMSFVERMTIIGKDTEQIIMQIFKPLKERIEQAEKGDA